MALYVGRHVGLGVIEFGLEKLDDALDARSGCNVRDAQALALGSDHLHELAPAQHQRLQPLQLGVGQRLA
jgi:hypothetical protein